MAQGQSKKSDKTDSAVDIVSAGNGDFEAQLFLAADKLRKNLEPSDYKHVVLGLIFLRHVSQSFEARYEQLQKEDAKAVEDPDEYTA